MIDPGPYLKKYAYIPIVTGPTASGKSAVALELCRMCGGELVSADSMQIYKGLDVGTAKDSKDERSEIPHHLTDIIEPGDDFSVFDFVTAAASFPSSAEVPVNTSPRFYSGSTTGKRMTMNAAKLKNIITAFWKKRERIHSIICWLNLILRPLQTFIRITLEGSSARLQSEEPPVSAFPRRTRDQNVKAPHSLLKHLCLRSTERYSMTGSTAGLIS